MNKRFFILSALLSIVGTVFAQTTSFSVKSPQEVPYGAIGEIEVNYQFEAEGVFTAYSMYLSLPEGFTLIDDGEGGYVMNGGDCNAASHTIAVNFSEGYYKMTCSSQQSTPFKNVSGTLLTIPVSVDGTKVELGKEYQASISNVMISYLDGQSKAINTDGINFTLKVIENRVIFDEASTKLPAYTAGKGNVRMTRKMTAGKWNTICLPFNLKTDQLKAAFGDDVAFAQFSGWKAEYDFKEEPYKPQSIEIQFSTRSTTPNVPGGKPFLVKPSKDVETFEFDDVTLVDKITDSSYGDAGDYGLSGVFKGTFVKTTVPENGLFISGEQFYYSKSSNSKGLTAIKGFRGWFELGAVLDEGTDFGAKISFTIDDEATEIDGIPSYQRITEGVYDLSGRKIQLENGDLNKLQKGVYIIDGKKVTIK